MPLPATIGRCRVVAEIGRGGMGVVYRGVDAAGRDVAIKLLRRLGPSEVARFNREQRLLGSLGEAEGFVPMLEEGDDPLGPYIVMPHLGGGTLGARLERGRLGIEESVRLVATLGRALGAAHARGIVHRDMKPDNVLFTHRGADSSWGRPLIADLGLAKHFRRDIPGASASGTVTRSGELVGTAGYMAREQLHGAANVGPPADVFSLGCILYQCLTGAPPFVADGIVELLVRVEGGRIGAPLLSLRPGVPPWLDALVTRTLDPDPARRPIDGRALALELEAAAPRRGPRRAILAASVAAVAAVTGLALATRGRPAPPAPTGPGPAPVKTSSIAVVTSARTRPLPPVYRDLLASKRARLTDAWGTLAGTHAFEVTAVAAARDGRWAVSAGQDTIVRFWDAATGEALRSFAPDVGVVTALAVSTDGKLLFTGSRDSTARLWDLEKDPPAERHKVKLESDVICGTLLEGSRYALVMDRARTVSLIELATGETKRSWLAGPTADVLTVAADGGRAILGRSDGTVTVVDLQTLGARIFKGYDGGVTAVAFSPEGGYILVGTQKGSLVLQDASTGTVLKSVAGDGRAIRTIVSPSLGRALSGGDGGALILWDLEAGTVLRTLVGHGQPVTSVAILGPDGRRAVSSSSDQTVRFWDLESGRETHPHEDHVGSVTGVAFTGDGRVVSCGRDGTVRLWERGRDRAVHKLEGHEGAVRAVATVPSRPTAVSGGDDGRLVPWDLTSGAAGRGASAGGPVKALALSPLGERALVGIGGALADGTPAGGVRLWDLASGEVRALAGAKAPVSSVAFSADGRRAFATEATGTFREWDLETLASSRSLRADVGLNPLRCSAVSPDGAREILGGMRKLWVRGLASDSEPLLPLDGCTGWVNAVRFAPSGRLALSGGLDARIWLWDCDAAVAADSLRLPEGMDFAMSVAFSDDERAFIAGTARGTILRFDLR